MSESFDMIRTDIDLLLVILVPRGLDLLSCCFIFCQPLCKIFTHVHHHSLNVTRRDWAHLEALRVKNCINAAGETRRPSLV